MSGKWRKKSSLPIDESLFHVKPDDQSKRSRVIPVVTSMPVPGMDAKSRALAEANKRIIELENQIQAARASERKTLAMIQAYQRQIASLKLKLGHTGEVQSHEEEITTDDLRSRLIFIARGFPLLCSALTHAIEMDADEVTGRFTLFFSVGQGFYIHLFEKSSQRERLKMVLRQEFSREFEIYTSIR